MAMNKAKGNMYPFVTHTWNPIRGRCLHDCEYCYIKRSGAMGWTHDVKLIDKEISRNGGTQLGEHNFIFVGSSTDMWGKWVPDHFIFDVLDYCSRFRYNKYLFQSKNPGRFKDFALMFPDKENTWLCTTVETNREKLTREICTAPAPVNRINEIAILKNHGFKTTLTIEPVIDFDIDEMLTYVEMVQPEWVSLGADSKGSDLVEPDGAKCRQLVDILQKMKIELKIKDNFKRILFNKGVK